MKQIQMRRFLLFTIEAYYPSGGMDDFVESYDDKEEAIRQGQSNSRQFVWWHILDTETGEIIEEGDAQ